MPPSNSSRTKASNETIVAAVSDQRNTILHTKKVCAWLASFLLTPPCSFHLPITPEDDSGYAIYVVTYTFATIGGVLVITIFFLIVAILVVRHRRNKKYDPPLLSEEQKIAVMKQTGYVNPTYKFFDQTVES